MWMQRFDVMIEECKALGATLRDKIQRTYQMKNLNKKKYEQMLLLWRRVLTRTTFPQTYDGLKAYITNEYEYSSQLTQANRAKVRYSVISTNLKKKMELSMQPEEAMKADKDECFIGDWKGHKMKKCWYYNVKKTPEQN
jgi:hypothetical protein